ncbi:hypothetical protein KQ41_07000 [Lysinibacillus fusiformis]|nr:hypothetical protein KQ41_07000 [Lysinibacillus fusiformis]
MLFKFIFLKGGEKMKLILASYNVPFMKKIGVDFEGLGGEIVAYVSSEEDLLNELVKHPDVKGVLIQSNLAKKHNDMRLDYLVDLLIGIKAEKKFKDINFTILSEVQKGHPFLAELVEMGIYSIYCINQKNIKVDNLYQSFVQPTSFSEAIHFRNVDSTIPWRRNLQTARTVELKFQSENQEIVHEKAPSKLMSAVKKAISNKIGKQETVNTGEMVHEEDTDTSSNQEQLQQQDNEIVNEEPIEDLIVSEEVIKEDPKTSKVWNIKKNSEPPKFKPIGTMLISVCGVEEHLGSTTAAISIAKYLAEQNYSVALVEGNYSQDFDRIHALSEGEKAIFKEDAFKLKGIPHFKYRPEMDLDNIFTSYDYVILDLGRLSDSPLENEFGRAHIKYVICSGDEWKKHWIDSFNREYGHYEGVNYLVPGANEKAIEDLRIHIKNDDCLPFPTLESPYQLSEDDCIAISTILSECVETSKKSKNYEKYKTWSLVATSMLVIILGYLILFN